MPRLHICATLLLVTATVGAANGPRQHDPVPVAACFAPGTSEAAMARVNETIQSPPVFDDDSIDLDVDYFFIGDRWSGGQGEPRLLTWSFVPDGLSVGGGIGDPTAPSELFERLDALFAAQGGRATWIGLFEESFARWSELTGTTYLRITFGGNDWDDGAVWGAPGGEDRGDVRISMKPIDGGSGVLGYNYFPGDGGDMVLDRHENWASASNNHRFMRNIVMHQHGHGLGISHVCSDDSEQLMEPFISLSFDGPQHDDLRAGQRHYGDPFEPNDDIGEATALGIIPTGEQIIFGEIPGPDIPASGLLSIDGSSDVDSYGVTVEDGVLVSITVTPRGRVYDDNPQEGGTCTSGADTNSLVIANLGVQLLADDGTILQTAESQPSGNSETISDFPVDPGDYFVRIYGAGASGSSQLYDFVVSTTGGAADIPDDVTQTESMVGGLRVWPNPSTGSVEIALADGVDRTHLDASIFGVDGRRLLTLDRSVLSGSWSWNGEIGGTTAPTGSYIVVLRRAGNVAATQRFTLVR